MPFTRLSGRAKYTCSNTQNVGAAISGIRCDVMPPLSITTISPGSTSRMNSASIRSNEQVSLDSTNASLSRPITSGRNPFGSRTPIILASWVKQISEYAPRTRRSAAVSRPSTSASRALAIRWTMTSVSLEVWKIDPLASSSARISCAFTRLPLWQIASWPPAYSTTNGWALRRSELPAVEYRTWPTAAAPGSLARVSRLKASETRPIAACLRSRPSPASRATRPADSCPRC